MKKTLHVVIDNNKPPHLAKELSKFWASTYQTWTIRHESEIAKPSSHDAHWIAKLSTVEHEGEWLIITSDKGRGDLKESDKLPILCKKHGHAYIILSPRLNKIEYCKAALACVAPQFELVITACRKLRHNKKAHVKLGEVTSKGNQVTYRLQVRGAALMEFLNPKRAAGQKVKGARGESEPLSASE